MSSVGSSRGPPLEERNSLPTQLETQSDGTTISVGSVNNIVIGNHATMVVTSCKAKSSYSSKGIPAKCPLSTSQQPLTMDQKMDIKDKVGRQWKDLGRRLGFSDSELEQLEMECTGNYSEVVYQLLTKWERRFTDEATQEALAVVFVKIKRGDLADLLSVES